MARLLSACAMLSAGAAIGREAQAPTVVSGGPAGVAVTIYRAGGRLPGAGLSGDWLDGFALISEERDVEVPAGRATLRFEGVAAGMLAESAIVTGLPADVREKNLDAQLLSPRNLYARAFGRPVLLRRLHPGSGQVEEEPAIIRSGPDGAAVVQTRHGFELANCGGLKDSIAYQGLPQGLNSRPTLSIQTDATSARHVRVRLSYLAWGFDWQAHYVLRLAPDGHGARMTAWLTLASGDDTGFNDAQASVVAGKLNFEENRENRGDDSSLPMECGLSQIAPAAYTPPPLMMAPAPQRAEIVVSAARMMKADYVAQAEALGDLHMYRLPMATTVAAHSRKQVALLAERDVKLVLVHTATVRPGAQGPVGMTVRLRNRREDGLGLALRGGRVSVVQPLHGAQIPAGEGGMEDKAVGETIDIAMGMSPQVQMATMVTRPTDPRRQIRLTVTNANRWPVRFEGKLNLSDGEVVVASSAALGKKDGLPLWAVAVPAHGRMVLTYTLERKGKR